MKILLTFFILIFYSNTLLAVREPRSLPIDSRVKIMVYNPDDVFKFTGYYDYHASIELAPDEEVVNIAMGDTTAWEIIPNGHRIFIKPVKPNAQTNMTLITNKPRTYLFELDAAETQDIRDPAMTFVLRFIYPDEEGSDHLQTYSTISASPDLGHPEKYNFNYFVSGDEEILPIKIFDDGEFTYLQFRDKNVELPALFAVDESLRESMVNYRLSQDNANMVIIEHVFKKLSVRHGKKIACIFNESFKPY